MSEVLSPAQNLDRVCELFIDEFSFDTKGIENQRTARVSGIDLSLGMRGIILSFRDEQEQQKHFETADRLTLSVEGNPSAEIITGKGESGSMAAYRFDRNTGLVIASSFPFPEGDTRAARRKDIDALEFSMATSCMLNDVMNRILTETGIQRITADLEKCLAEA